MKRPLVMVALLYTGGVLLGNFWPLPLPWLYAFSFALSLASLIDAPARAFLIWPLVLFAGWTNLSTRTAVVSPFDLRTLVGTNVELITLRGALSETPSQRVYEFHEKESWHTLARVDVTAVQRGANWQPAFGRVAVTTPGVLGSNYFGGQTLEITRGVQPPKGSAAGGLVDYRA